MATIKFPLSELDVAESIREFLDANIEEIYPALTFPEQDQNERVQIDDVSVNSVEIHDDGTLEIEYEYSWSFYAGCKDINASGIEQEAVKARLVGGVIEFDVLERPEPRSTSDEL